MLQLLLMQQLSLMVDWLLKVLQVLRHLLMLLLVLLQSMQV